MPPGSLTQRLGAVMGSGGAGLVADEPLLSFPCSTSISLESSDVGISDVSLGARLGLVRWAEQLWGRRGHVAAETCPGWGG